MPLVFPLTCRFNLAQSRLVLYVLAFVLDYPEEGWVRRAVLYEAFCDWKDEQEKGMFYDQRLPLPSEDHFYAQLHNLRLQSRQERWTYYYMAQVPEDLHVSFYKEQYSERVGFYLEERPPVTAVTTEAVAKTRHTATTPTEDVEEASAAIALMAQKPKHLPPAVLVQESYDALLVVLQNGYTYTEIAALYGRHNIKVTPGQLKVEVEALRVQKEQAEVLATSQPQASDEPLTVTAHRSQGLLRTKLTDCQEALRLQ